MRWKGSALVTAAALGLLWPTALPTRPPVAPPPVAGAPVPQTALPGPGPQAPAETSPTAPPVPESAPRRLVDEWPQLEARARRGDARAACQLAQGMRECWAVSRVASNLTMLTQTASELEGGEEFDRIVDIMADMEEEWEPETARCEGLPAVELARGWEHQVRAADLGDVEAGYLFTVNPPLDPEEVLDHLEAWQVYRDRYWSYIDRAIAAGHLGALWSAASIAAGTQSVQGLSRTQFRDPARSWAYLHALRRILDDDAYATLQEAEVAARAALTPEQAAAAERRGVQLWSEHFAATAPTFEGIYSTEGLGSGCE